MTITESLDTLTGGLPFDATTVMQRVAQRVIGQLMSDGVFSTDGGASPEDVIASSVGNWLTQAMRPDQAALPAGPVIDVESTDDSALLDDLVDRNSALAAAVGACDCWGDEPDCPFCEGFGAAGWMTPDRRLFATYVYPAVRSLNAARDHRVARGSHNHHRKGQPR